MRIPELASWTTRSSLSFLRCAADCWAPTSSVASPLPATSGLIWMIWMVKCSCKYVASVCLHCLLAPFTLTLTLTGPVIWCSLSTRNGVPKKIETGWKDCVPHQIRWIYPIEIGKPMENALFYYITKSQSTGEEFILTSHCSLGRKVSKTCLGLEVWGTKPQTVGLDVLYTVQIWLKIM